MEHLRPWSHTTNLAHCDRTGLFAHATGANLGAAAFTQPLFEPHVQRVRPQMSELTSIHGWRRGPLTSAIFTHAMYSNHPYPTSYSLGYEARLLEHPLIRLNTGYKSGESHQGIDFCMVFGAFGERLSNRFQSLSISYHLSF